MSTNEFWGSVADWVQVLTSLAALLIAVAVAWRQTLLQERQLNQDLFDRRLDVFRTIQKFMEQVQVTPYLTAEEVGQLTTDTMHVQFLFGAEVQGFRKRFLAYAWEYGGDPTVGSEGEQVEWSLSNRAAYWFSFEASNELLAVFAHYLNLQPRRLGADVHTLVLKIAKWVDEERPK